MCSINFRQVQQMQVPAQFNGGSWKQKRIKFVRQFKSNVREFLYFFSLWGKTLQKIGGRNLVYASKQPQRLRPRWQTLLCLTGNFGGGVQSYFIFLRFLVILNFVSFLLIAGFVLIPSIVFRSVGIKPESSKADVSSGLTGFSGMLPFIFNQLYFLCSPVRQVIFVKQEAGLSV